MKANRKEKQLNNAPALTVAQRTMRKRAILAGVSALLVLMLILGAVYAWYTRLVNVTGMTFDVAEFDINASYVTESMIINPYTYQTVADGLSAPGVMGYIPVEISSSTTNEVDVTYRLNIDNSSMASEFTDRIQFFYYTEGEDGEYVKNYLGLGTDDIEGYLVAGAQTVTEHIYWEWIYEADISSILIAPTEEPKNSNTETMTYTLFSTLNEMTNVQIYQAIAYWQDAQADDDYYAEYCADCVLDVMNLSKTSDLYLLYTGKEVTVSANAVYGSKTYAAVDEDDEDFESICGANMRDYIQCYSAAFDWDYIDTQVATGVWDEEMISANGSTYTSATYEDEDGDEYTYTAYQEAMQVSLKMTGLQAEVVADDGTVTASSTGTATIEYGSLDLSTE